MDTHLVSAMRKRWAPKLNDDTIVQCLLKHSSGVQDHRPMGVAAARRIGFHTGDGTAQIIESFLVRHGGAGHPEAVCRERLLLAGTVSSSVDQEADLCDGVLVPTAG